MHKVCKFCLNLGKELPHDHTVRDFQKPNFPIICPILLTNKCTYCHQKGHTKKYCSILNKKLVKVSNNIDNNNIDNNDNNKVDIETKGFTYTINAKKREFENMNNFDSSSDEEYELKNKKIKIN